MLGYTKSFLKTVYQVHTAKQAATFYFNTNVIVRRKHMKCRTVTKTPLLQISETLTFSITTNNPEDSLSGPLRFCFWPQFPLPKSTILYIIFLDHIQPSNRKKHCSQKLHCTNISCHLFLFHFIFRHLIFLLKNFSILIFTSQFIRLGS